MGKAVGSIEKHRICADSPNKVAIVERVGAIKEAWHKSVKVRKDKPQNSISTDDKSSSKRELENSSQSSSPTAKKIKLDDTKKSSFSSLLKKVAPNSSILGSSDKSSSLANDDVSKKTVSSKKPGKRLKWKDHFGGKLEVSKILEDAETETDENVDESSGSWSDRKKRDRLREKELIAKAKYVHVKNFRLFFTSLLIKMIRFSLFTDCYSLPGKQNFWMTTMTTTWDRKLNYLWQCNRRLHGTSPRYFQNVKMLLPHKTIQKKR